MFTVSNCCTHKIYTVYDVKIIDNKTKFLVFEQIDYPKDNPDIHFGWNYEDASLFIPSLLT